jgi:hypothetical protein
MPFTFKILILLFSYQCFADLRRYAEETTVSKVVIGLIQSKNPDWKIRSRVLQDAVTESINNKSYLEALPTNVDFGTGLSDEKYFKIGEHYKVDGVFAFEARSFSSENRSNEIRVVLKSGRNGRTMSAWRFPYKEPLSDPDLKTLAQQIATAIIADFPYIGYVKKVSGKSVLVNLGKKFKATEGTVLQVFEFEDEEPTFSSQKTILGRVMITKVAENGAIARVSRSSGGMHSFAKLEPYQKNANRQLDLSNRYFEDLWVSLGPQFTLLDTSAPDDRISSQRKYRVTLTPFYRLAAGMGPFVARFTYGKGNDEGTQMTYTEADFYYDVLLWDIGEKWKAYTGLGVNYAYYSFENSPRYVSATQYSPMLDQGFYYQVGPTTRLFLGFQLRYPTFASPILTAEAQPTTSYGLGGYIGLRVQVTPTVAFEGSVLNKLTTWQYTTGKLQEILFTSSFSGIYLF